VQRACAELALKAATADLAADVGQTARRVKVGPIEKEYAPNASPVKRYRAVDLLLAPFLSGSDMNIRVVRA
jgi:hypothetical protein